MTVEQIVMALFILLVVGVNFVAPVLRRMLQEQERQRPESGAPIASIRRRASPVKASRATQIARHGPARSATTVKRRRPAAVTLREARRGLVLMTILGPCRAADPSGSATQFP